MVYCMSQYNWVVFHPLYTLNHQGFFHCSNISIILPTSSSFAKCQLAVPQRKMFILCHPMDNTGRCLPWGGTRGWRQGGKAGVRFEVISDGGFRPTPGILPLETSAWKRVNHQHCSPKGWWWNSHDGDDHSHDRICKENHHLPVPNK